MILFNAQTFWFTLNTICVHGRGKAGTEGDFERDMDKGRPQAPLE
jgi:hypothetical protein